MAEETVHKKIIPHQLDPAVYQELEHIVGTEWISQDRAVLETYSKLSLDAEGFLKKFHKDASSLPACEVVPVSTDEVQSIIRLANRCRIAFIPFTNGQAFSAPPEDMPTICIHLSRMNRVLSPPRNENRMPARSTGDDRFPISEIAGAAVDLGFGARRPRRESNGPDVHRRPKWRMALPSTFQGRRGKPPNDRVAI